MNNILIKKLGLPNIRDRNQTITRKLLVVGCWLLVVAK